MTADGVDTFIEVGPGKVLTNLIKRIAPDATAIALDDVLAGEGLDLPVLVPPAPTPADPTSPLTQGAHPCAAQITPAASSSPASASSARSATTATTAWSNLVEGRSGLAELTRFDVSRLRAQGRRRGPRLRRRRRGWTRRPSAAASARCTTASRRRSRPLADSGLRDRRREPDRRRRRLRLRRRRPAADDRQLHDARSRRARTASSRRSSPTPSSTRRPG